MKKIIQNSHNSWHAGVQAIDCLPDGSNPVPPGSWERLLVKIETREHRKKIKRFYLLAASVSSLIILLAVGSYVWNSNTRKSGTTVIVKNNSPVAPLPEIDSNSDQKIVVKANPTAPVIKEHSARRQQKSLHTAALSDSLDQKPLVLNAIDSSVDQQQTPKQDAFVNAPVKKRYNVKHINDFADPLESTPGMTIKVKPLLRYMWPDENSGKATLDQPVKEHNINTSPHNQN